VDVDLPTVRSVMGVAGGGTLVMDEETETLRVVAEHVAPFLGLRFPDVVSRCGQASLTGVPASA
jgi:hypothetical protein